MTRTLKRVLRNPVSAVVPAFLALLVSCATTPRGPSDRPMYYGYGTGRSVTSALNAAKQDVLRQVVVDLIGRPSAAAHRETIEREIYRRGAINAFFFLDTMEIISRGKQGDEFFSQIGIRVNLSALSRTLRSAGVYGGQVTPSPDDKLALPDREPPASSPVSEAVRERTTDTAREAARETPRRAPPASSESAKLTPEERAVIEEYIRSLTFMIYFDESAPEDPFIKKAAVTMANGYLAEHRRAAVDLETVERIKKDQELVYEEQTGRSVGLIQWVAQKVNADVYAELDARTSGDRSGANYYGQANLTLKFFEASTGRLLASVTYKSPRSFSRSSETDAINNALQSSVYEAMSIAMDQLGPALRASAVNGIPYRLILQNTPDARLTREFARRLERRVESVETVSQSKEETVYTVFSFGKPEDLLDIVFDVSDALPAFSGMELVVLRGRSLTFDTGL